jgi:uncharacterized protein YjiS (DUF1127 family)
MTFLHSGISSLSEVIRPQMPYNKGISRKEKTMLRSIYNAIVISRATSAAHATLNHLTDRDLADMGFTRYNFVETIVNSVRDDLKTDTNKKSVGDVYNAIANPNLVGAV